MRDMAVHGGEIPQYQSTESRLGPRTAADLAGWRKLVVASSDRRRTDDELVNNANYHLLQK